jgi:hypothetical protein
MGYPAAAGLPELRQAISAWCGRRFGAAVDADLHVIPTLGSKEAIFSFAQVVLDSPAGRDTVVVSEPGYPVPGRGAAFAGARVVELPLLEHALLELWERRRGATLTLGGYRESGGVAGAIAKRAEALFDGMTPDEQRVARQAMLRLTQPGEGTEDTRRRAPLSELVTSEASEPDVHRVVAEMVEARLLTTTSDGSGEEWVDVSHEALIRAWPRLRGWLDEDRAGLLVHRRLTDAAHEWQRLQRDDAVLYRGQTTTARQNCTAATPLPLAVIDATP